MIYSEGSWGFEFYAERLGMRPINADHTVLHPGEWLVIPQPNVSAEVTADDSNALIPFEPIQVDDLIPFSMLKYYGGNPPLEYRHAPRQTVFVMRAQKDTRLVTDWDIAGLPEWVHRLRGSGFAAPALPFLFSKLNAPDEATRVQAALALGEFGPEGSTAEPRWRTTEGSESARSRDLLQRAPAALVHCHAETLQKLESATHDPDPKVRSAAMGAAPSCETINVSN